MKPFEPLFAWLAWQPDATDHLQAFCDTRLAWLTRQLTTELTRPAASLIDLATLWSALSLDALDRIVRAPIVCQCLRVDSERPLLRRALTAEFILDLRPDLRVDQWSALGDVWLGDTPPQPLAAMLSPAPDGRRYQGPALACGIPIDLSMPAAIAYPGAGVPKPDLPDAWQTAASLSRLDKAVARIAEASPVMHRSVLELVSNILLRTDHTSPQNLQSASSAASLGRVVLINAHDAHNSTALLGEVLIHEATHTAVSTVELVTPLVTDTPGLAQCCIPSPWTGASLPVHAFLHACLVWFALSGFWARLDQDTETHAEATMRRAIIREGFRALEPDIALASYRDRLHDDAIPLLNAVREKALTA